jgi:membrane dipeptidase
VTASNVVESSTAVSARAAELYALARVWDMVLPWEPEMGNDVALLSRWHAAGVDFVSVHPAGDRHNVGEAVRRIAHARADILGAPDELVLAESVEDIERARVEGKLAVGLHVEGSRLFERDVAVIEAFYKLGIRFCHPVFNLLNSFGGGCSDSPDVGISKFGRSVVHEMNRVGMLLDGAHVGRRTTLDMLEISTSPVVFSHVACAAVFPHFRNVNDEQIRACAASGGVVGLTGNNNYLGDDPSVETLFRHLDHVVELVGPDHVGLGIDYVDDAPALDEYVRARPDEWAGSWRPFAFATPDQFPALVDRMLAAGYPEPSVRGVLGENWLRVCANVWK